MPPPTLSADVLCSINLYAISDAIPGGITMPEYADENSIVRPS